MTNESGDYAFLSNLENANYEITVLKDDDHTNGVSTLDLVLIQRHIVGFADLDSPYKVIAADINRDDKVSSIDIVELRKLILGVQEEFESNTSWRFVDNTQQFVDPLAPWPVDEQKDIDDLTANMTAEDFVAVKIGDVNATATHNVVGANTEVRSGNTMLLEIEDKAVKAGDLVEIVVSSAEFKNVAGLQMTMEFDGLTFSDIAGNAINVNAGNVGFISDKVITMSWNTSATVTTTENLFVITALATKNGNISEMINVTNRVITPEVYTSITADSGGTLEINNIEFGIRGGKTVALANELMQNEPNPFKESTTISFNLAKASKATLTVRDVAGKLIYTINGDYNAGLNTITLENLDVAGVLYYSLEAEDYTATRKMIVIE